MVVTGCLSILSRYKEVNVKGKADSRSGGKKRVGKESDR